MSRILCIALDDCRRQYYFVCKKAKGKGGFIKLDEKWYYYATIFLWGEAAGNRIDRSKKCTHTYINWFNWFVCQYSIETIIIKCLMTCEIGFACDILLVYSEWS